MADVPDWDDMVMVGRIARPHGLRGQVAVNPETDFMEERFRPGAHLWMRTPRGQQELTIDTVRFQRERPIVGFEGFSSIDDVEPLAGLELRIPPEALQPLDPGHYYEHELVGCEVETVSGRPIGTVARVEGGTGGSRLVVDGDPEEILVPLALDICVEIDVAAKRIRIDPPEGLLELNVKTRSRQ